MKLLCALLFCPLLAVAQPTGVAATWDVSKAVATLSAQASRLEPLLGELKPQAWVEQGAPAAYVSQWNGVKQELGFMRRAASNLEKQPEKLTLALEALFRLQSVEAGIYSLVDGVRKYQNPAVGDLLIGVMLENSDNRDRLRDYVTDLAEQKELEIEKAFAAATTTEQLKAFAAGNSGHSLAGIAQLRIADEIGRAHV